MKHATVTLAPRHNENVLILFVLIIGLAGLLLAFRGQTNSKNQQLRLSFENESVALSNTGSRLLQIEGDLQAGAPIQFQLRESISLSGFIIDFGNGITQRVEKDSFSFTYYQPDIYNIQVRDNLGRVIEYLEIDIAPQSIAMR